MPNALANATSPYLRQHQDNPVDWRPWTAQALADAKARDRPILLSIGYAACHWCHVMAHESFEDAAIARLMNDNFVCVKVDREERPDLDHIYQSALSAMGEHGGWPLTMFLTPDGAPFWGGTYIPPEPRWGRPGFPDLLRQLITIFRESPERITATTNGLASALRTNMDRASTALSERSRQDVDAQAKWLAGVMDNVAGGFPGAPKFPMAMVLDFLWRGFLRTGDPAMETAVTVALSHMAQGGIYDHLGGGFSRYATDDRWLVPHFEKMLYDNALLLSTLTNAWAHNSNPLYEARVRETVAWVEREMTTDTGGFVSSFDADSEGVEGKFYVWTSEEIEAVLGLSDADVFAGYYDVSAAGNWENKTILNRSHASELRDTKMEDSLAVMRTTLLAVRAKRVAPDRDDKVLADWNGLMIAALARASITFQEPSWLVAGTRAFDHVRRFQSDDSRLCHSSLGEATSQVSFLSDYGAMSGAALALFEATGRADYVTQAELWIGVLDDQFLDRDNGGYFFTAADGDALIMRPRHAIDDATPSGNALAADALARLYYLTGKETYRQRAEAIHRAFTATEDHDVVGLASLLNAAEVLETGLEIIVLGDPGDASAQALIHAAHVSGPPHRILHWVAVDQKLPPHHPAFGKRQLDGMATAFVCIRQSCSLPITDVRALKSHLAMTIQESQS
jgi:uncharacterized protein YyaL (SSP411 family)